MNHLHKITLAVVCLGTLLTISKITADNYDSEINRHQRQNCARHTQGLIKNIPAYQTLYQTLNPNVAAFGSLLYAVQLNSANYTALYNFALTVAAELSTGRIVIADPDGLVAVDTGKGGLNTYANYQAGANPATFANAINVNHNSRISFINAQEWPCGLGCETKFSNSVQTTQNYVAIRLERIPGSNAGLPIDNDMDDSYLNSVGTVRMSINAA
jgi:hypothetical protein